MISPYTEEHDVVLDEIDQGSDTRNLDCTEREMEDEIFK